MTGKVARILTDKKFGFIKGEDRKEYFFHKQDYLGDFDDLAIDLETGRNLTVTFDSVPSTKGPRAGRVELTGREISNHDS